MVRNFIKKMAGKILGERSTKDQKPAEEAPQKREPVQSRSRNRRPSYNTRPPRKQWSLEEFQVSPKNDEKRFHDFNVPAQIMHAIYDLGFKYCTPIQSKMFTHASKQENIAGRAQTGTGKTAAFLISIFSRFLTSNKGKPKPGTPRALILGPTRELVLQIIKDAQDLGKYCPFKCVAVYGGMDMQEQRKSLGKPVDLVAATPGRLLDFKQRGVIDLREVEVLVIDEADRMLDMGFIPDVSRIIRATPPKNKRQTMLFSATLTDRVLELASQWMPDPVICEIDPEQVAVDTVKQVIYIVRTQDKFKLLFNILSQKNMDRILIFGNRRDTTKRLTDNLKRHGIKCAYLSGAVRQEERLKILAGFREGRINIVVATDVAGRGLHVDDISHVINYEFPYEPEDYVHRIGRTGRAGSKGTAISFACEDESFVIPEIEEYIGAPLPAVMPDPELLAPIPRGH